MKKAAKENITEEIIVSPEEVVDGVKEEAIEAPSRLRENCANWQPCGDVLASGPAPRGLRLCTTALPGYTARSSRR
jgi:hypothetical protein